MNLFDFQLLPRAEQLDLLYIDGVYIGKQKEEHTIKLLYQLESFYVELTYTRHRRYVTRLYCFSSAAMLDPYLEGMDVEGLVFYQ
jgi:hypothetical protein